ncbi:hypothetical protein JCM8208_004544 [Rhodotorula glutinis]
MSNDAPEASTSAPSTSARPPLAATASHGDSTESSVAHEHDDDYDRDELEDEAEDAASSEGRPRSPEVDAALAPAAMDSMSAAAGEPARKAVFPNGGKTQAAFVHNMVDTPALQNLISWSADGKSFLVYSPEEFARTVLPQFFKHSNFASFLRQLNFYSWSKVNDVLGSNQPTLKPDGTPVQAWEFRNPNFQRGRPDLLARIKRKTARSNATAQATPALPRRRSSVSALSSLRASRRDLALGTASDAGMSAEERDGEGSTSSFPTGVGIPSGPPTPRPPTRDDYAAPSKRIAAGLADFAPFAAEPSMSQVRAKDENSDARPPSGRVSPTYARHPPPPPIQPTTYVVPHQFSPGTRTYPLPPSSLSSGYRYPYTEEPLVRQVSTLEGQVRSLSDALHYSQQEFVGMRNASHAVLQTMLGIVARLDPDGQQSDEIQAASAALAKLHPDAAPPHSYPNPFAYATGLSWPTSHAFPSPRPSTAQSQFYYNRIPAAESYTRSSRSDSRPDPAAVSQLASRPGTGADIRSSISTLPSPRPPSSSAAYESTRPASSSLAPVQGSARPRSAGPPPGGSYSAWAAARPECHLGHGAPSSYGTANGVVGEADGSKPPTPTTTLPPLSSLLNPSSGPAPPHSFGEDERGIDAFDDADERARKKQRQQR